jgi:hypothetical protein
MYYRNFRPAEKRNENNVPVQYFGDSFSADAFAKKDNARKKESVCDVCDNRKETEDPEKKEIKPDEHKAKDIDDLLLLGLILLFLTDCQCKEDIIIPVILGIILLS